MNCTAPELAAALRRQNDLVWPKAIPRPSGPAGPGIVATLETPVWLGLHPGQSDASLQGALALIDDTEGLLREISGFDAYCWGLATVGESVSVLRYLSQKWAEVRRGPGPFHRTVVSISGEGEVGETESSHAQSGRQGFRVQTWKQDPSRIDLSGVVLLSNAAVEELGEGLGRLVWAVHEAGGHCGLMQTNPSWLAAGFWPPQHRLDFAVVDLSRWAGSSGGLLVLACNLELEPFLPQPRWRMLPEGFSRQRDRVLSTGTQAGPLPQIAAVAAAHCSLRHQGMDGLKELTRQAILRVAVAEQKLIRRLSASSVRSSLHEIWIPSLQRHWHWSGWEDEYHSARVTSWLAGAEWSSEPW